MARKSSRPPGAYRATRAQYRGVVEAYERLGDETRKAGPLTLREQRLVKLGLAFGARMEGAAHSAVRKALDAGLSTAELEHAALLAMTTLGFPNGIACLCWVRDEAGGTRGKKKK